MERHLPFGEQQLAHLRPHGAEGHGLQFLAIVRGERAADVVATCLVGVKYAMRGKREDRRRMARAIRPRLFQKLDQLQRGAANGECGINRERAVTRQRNLRRKLLLHEAAKVAQAFLLHGEARRHGVSPALLDQP